MSFSAGDTVFLCSPSGPVQAEFVGRVGPDCVIAVGGARMPVLCSRLKSSAAECPSDAVTFNVGQRVTLRMVDAQFGLRVWPGTVRKLFANGRVSVALDGLSHPQSIEPKDLVKL